MSAETNYTKLSQKIDSIKSDTAKEIDKMSRINMAVMAEHEGLKQEISLLRFLTGLLLDKLDLGMQKEIEIDEKEFEEYFRPLMKTEKGDYYFNIGTKTLQLVDPILRNWEVSGRENNTIKWRNTESEAESSIEYIYDQALSPEQNTLNMVNKFKAKLRHPIELITV
ncbi:MAG TPA: hypothetical protein VIK77_00295 [Tissierellaceae bacterium]